MSDEDRDIDIESDADDEEPTQTYSSDDKRAHHNALERKRRDHIKDSFHSLRDCVPQEDNKTNSSSKVRTVTDSDAGGSGPKSTSRAQILRQAAEYIIRMRDKTTQNDRHIQILKQQNEELQAQIKSLQKSQGGAKAGQSSSSYKVAHGDDEYESYEEETVVTSPPPKKKKTKS